MDWKIHIEALKRNETVSFRPKGHSMEGRISSGQLVTVVPVGHDYDIEVGDIVFCSVRGRCYVHLVKAIDPKRGYLIGNNKGGENGWTHTIYGLVGSVED